jgi:hypothetical protein
MPPLRPLKATATQVLWRASRSPTVREDVATALDHQPGHPQSRHHTPVAAAESLSTAPPARPLARARVVAASASGLRPHAGADPAVAASGRLGGDSTSPSRDAVARTAW